MAAGSRLRPHSDSRMPRSLLRAPAGSGNRSGRAPRLHAVTPSPLLQFRTFPFVSEIESCLEQNIRRLSRACAPNSCPHARAKLKKNISISGGRRVDMTP